MRCLPARQWRSLMRCIQVRLSGCVVLQRDCPIAEPAWVTSMLLSSVMVLTHGCCLKCWFDVKRRWLNRNSCCSASPGVIHILMEKKQTRTLDFNNTESEYWTTCIHGLKILFKSACTCMSYNKSTDCTSKLYFLHYLKNDVLSEKCVNCFFFEVFSETATVYIDVLHIIKITCFR